MERNKPLRKQNQKVRNRMILEWIITRVIVVAFVIGCIISIATTQSTLTEKREELNEIEAAIAEIETDNVELERILDSDDMQAYMEKQAIEQLNYAYPNERRFYDTSRD
ncbi:MAG: septum formation initiator family protein [Oscillospiraceae bacterium]|nr:septum formation initiator family protein [Oscillospiraceae bacterium]